MKKVYNVESVPSVKKLSEFLHEKIHRIDPNLKTEIINVLEGVERLDGEVKQKEQLLVQKESVINEKTAEVRNKDSLLVQKEREEFIEVLQRLDPSYTDHIGDWPNNIYKQAVINGNPKLISESLPVLKQSFLIKEFISVLNKINAELYKTDIVSLNSNQFSSAVRDWPDNIYKQAVIENNVEGIKLISDSLPILKGRYLLRNEFIEILHKLNPESYPKDFEDWSVSRGKELIDNEDYTTISSIIPIYRKELEKKLVFQRENELARKEQLLIDQHKKEIEDIKALVVQKELENQKLLIQNAEELHNKSLAKNQVIGELQEDIGLKEKEAYKLQIESLMKQVEFHKKESEFKDKALENALEIGKQNKIISELKEKELADAHVINELQGKLLAVVDLHKDGKDMPNIEVLKYQVNESILSGNVEDMKEFSKYLSELMKNPADKDESLEISELLNLSPIGHVEANIVQNPIPVINNFDINNVHTTHSVLISMSGEDSFSIIQEDGSH